MKWWWVEPTNLDGGFPLMFNKGNSLGCKKAIKAKEKLMEGHWCLNLHTNTMISKLLGNISSLLSLALGKNHLEGNIPTELGQLSNLQFLQLGLNNLSGTVPTQLYNISSIYHFGLADNQLQGQIPPYISLSLPDVEFIFLGGNKFSGPIPISIVNSSRLIELDMGLNALSGPIPKNLGSLQNIQILSFAVNFLENSNDFSFLISLTNCTNLSYLQLSQNNLTGVLPDSIGNFSANLIELKIDTNYISGTIPKEIGNLVGLEFLSLHKNMLTGKIVKKGRNFPRRVVIATGIVLFVVLFLMCLCAIKQVGLSRRNEDNASPLENKHLKLSYAELLHATNDFSSANIIAGCQSDIQC
ncbi:hypothetical protein V6N12_043204 [Hibiscus sabdariffa]|uniref:Uncharacterized protein n=1 Tax=Hibiscus sabdariffa TaxID=183260 RepID=A0ABR2DEM9_9ROSI